MKLMNRFLATAAIAATGVVVLAGVYTEGHRVPDQP